MRQIALGSTFATFLTGTFLDKDFAPPPYSFGPEICTSKFMHCFAWNASNNCSVDNLVLILGKSPYKEQNEKNGTYFGIWSLFSKNIDGRTMNC